MTPQHPHGDTSRSEKGVGFSEAYADFVAAQERLKVARAFLQQTEDEAAAAEAHLMLYVAVYWTDVLNQKDTSHG